MSDQVKTKIAINVILITLLFSILGFAFPKFLVLIQYPLLGILLIAIGLPHGATDYLLFKRIQKSRLQKNQIIIFFLKYISAVLGFLVLWLVFPFLSFVIFILISSYHFGQSNWESINVSNKYKFILNLFWGAFAIGGSVLWHWQTSKLIIGQVIGFVPDVSQDVMNMVQLGLVFINFIFVLILKNSKVLTTMQTWRELVKLVVLCCLFYFTPMLVSFAIYFALWHSLGSLISQLSFYRTLWPEFTLSEYYRQAAPYTLLAVLGFVVMVFGHSYIFPGVSMISTFLVFIACVTLPHIFLVEESYHH